MSRPPCYQRVSESGWPDLNRRPLDPQTESGGFGDLAFLRFLTSDLGFCWSLAFIVLQCYSFSADFSRTLDTRAVSDTPTGMAIPGLWQSPCSPGILTSSG